MCRIIVIFALYRQKQQTKMEKTEFEHHVSSLRQSLLKIGISYLGNEEDAEDLVQDTLAKLWMLRQRFDDAQHMQRLACVVARNSAISMLRERKYHATTYNESTAIEVATPINAQHMMEDDESQEMLTSCISMLPDKQKAILRMRNVEQLSYSDIANILSTSEASVRKLISRARKTLMANMRAKGGMY